MQNQEPTTLSPWRKAMVAGVAGLSIAGGSIAVAGLSPLGIAGAQEDSSSDASSDAVTDLDTDRPERGDIFAGVLQSLVDDGTITDSQSDTIAERFAAARDEVRDRVGDGHRGQGRGIRGGFDLDVVTDITGLTAEEIRAGLEAGQTIGGLAGDDVDELRAALVTQANERLDAAVESDRVDEERAAEVRASIEERIDAMLDGELRDRDGFGRHGADSDSAENDVSDGETIDS